MSSNRPWKTDRFFQGFGDEPKLEDFGVTAEEYDKFARGHSPWNTPLQVIAFIIAVITGLGIGFTYENVGDGFLGRFFIYLGLGAFAGVISELLTRRHPLYRKAKL